MTLLRVFYCVLLSSLGIDRAYTFQGLTTPATLIRPPPATFGLVPPAKVVSSPRGKQRSQQPWKLSQTENGNNIPAPANNNSNINKPVIPVLQETSRLLKRTSWFSWWVQTILSVISCTILLFAANASQTNKAANPPSFFLSSLGLTVSAVSIIWTWGNGTRLSRRLLRDNQPQQKQGFTPAPPGQLLRRAMRVQVSLNLVGLFLTLLAAEEIVGSLALKVLTAGSATMYGPIAGAAGSPTGFVQPLDILIVQANTNTLLSHFVSLTSSLYLTDRVKLFPGDGQQQTRQGNP